MPEDIELQARRLNEADKELRSAISTYRAEGYTQEEFEERIDELWSEDDG